MISVSMFASMFFLLLELKIEFFSVDASGTTVSARLYSKEPMMSIAIPQLLDDVIQVIISFVCFHGSDWLHIKLVCKRWKQIGDRLFDPSSIEGSLQRMIAKNNAVAVEWLIKDNRMVEIMNRVAFGRPSKPRQIHSNRMLVDYNMLPVVPIGEELLMLGCRSRSMVIFLKGMACL